MSQRCQRELYFSWNYYVYLKHILLKLDRFQTFISWNNKFGMIHQMLLYKDSNGFFTCWNKCWVQQKSQQSKNVWSGQQFLSAFLLLSTDACSGNLFNITLRTDIHGKNVTWNHQTISDFKCASRDFMPNCSASIQCKWQIEITYSE